MRYGIENETTALKQYGDIKRVTVAKSGLWIHKDYLHLAASPDGLVYDQSSNLICIVEVKCLKLLQLHSVENILQKECPSSELKRQCFDVKNGQLLLKTSHSYYYQVQLQLLMTQASYCDFVLYSSKGPPHIQSIYPDAELQKKIVSGTKSFWEKILIPEYFLMRVPRDLLPIVL